MSSRQRGRGGTSRDGASATAEEQNLMEEVTMYFKQVHDLEEEQKALAEQIRDMEAEIAKSGNSKSPGPKIHRIRPYFTHIIAHETMPPVPFRYRFCLIDPS